MKVAKQTRMRQKRRWRPSLIDIICRTVRKHKDSLIENITANNPFYRRLREMELEE